MKRVIGDASLESIAKAEKKFDGFFRSVVSGVVKALAEMQTAPANIDHVWPGDAVLVEQFIATAGRPLIEGFVHGAMTEFELFDRVQAEKGWPDALRKQTSAQSVLAILGISDFGEWFDFEVPAWLREAAFNTMETTFQQPYWRQVMATTRVDIEETLRRGIADGLSIPKLTKLIVAKHGAEYTAARAKNVARTELGNAMNAGHVAGIKKLAKDVPELDIGKEWLSVFATLTRRGHAANDGVVVPADGMFMLSGISIPWPGHWNLGAGDRCNCVPGTALIQGADVQRVQRAWYEGPVREIVLATGGRLTVTPNHPVLTKNGFVAAGQLDIGQQLIRATEKVNRATTVPDRSFVGSGGDDINGKPIAIAKFFEFVALVSNTVSAVDEIRRGTEIDFDGDGKFVKGYVDNIDVDKVLDMMFDVVGIEELGNFTFAAMLEKFLSTVSGNNTFGRINRTASGILSEFCRTFPTGQLSLVGDRVTSRLSVGHGTQFDTAFIQKTRQSDSRDIVDLRELQNGSAVDVCFDDIVAIENRNFCGHVFDLSTNDGVFVCDSYIISNCLCTVLSSFVTKELGISQQADESTSSTVQEPADLFDKISQSKRLNDIVDAVTSDKTLNTTPAFDSHLAKNAEKMAAYDEYVRLRKLQSVDRFAVLSKYNDLVDELEKLKAIAEKEQITNAKRFVEIAGVKPENRVAIKSVAKTDAVRGVKINKKIEKKLADKISKAEEFVAGMTDKKIFSTAEVEAPWHQLRAGQRAFQWGTLDKWDGNISGVGMYLDGGDDIGVAVHELIHSVEVRAGRGRVEKLCNEFAKRRIAASGKQSESMSKLFPEYGFGHSEVGNDDSFGKYFDQRGSNPASKYYCGKTYSIGATEVLSMGVELLFRDPAAFARLDPEYFKFCVGILSGDL